MILIVYDNKTTRVLLLSFVDRNIASDARLRNINCIQKKKEKKKKCEL